MPAPRVSILPSSRGPAIALGAVTLASIGAVVYSHYAQVRDKTVMRQGVERDKERLQRIKMERDRSDS
jgi:PET assembly of cytochrome c oxidase, mitochondrial